MLACMALSLAGGMYAPPVRVVRANTSSSFVFLGALSFLSPSPVSPPASLQIRITSKIHVTGSSLIISVTVFLKSFLSGIHRFTFSKNFFLFKEKFTTRSTFIFCALLSIFITPFPIINYHSQIIFHKTNSLSGYKQIQNRNTNFTSTENGDLHRMRTCQSACCTSVCAYPGRGTSVALLSLYPMTSSFCRPFVYQVIACHLAYHPCSALS